MSSVVIAGDTSGTVTLQAPAIAGTTTLNLPATSGTIITGAGGVTAVSSGGTGATSLTANAVILGNGTSAVQTVAPGTSGNALISNGTTWTSATLSVTGRLVNIQYFTSTATYTPTSGTTFVVVEVLGGGSGGTNTFAGCSGGYARKKITSAFSGVTVTIGAGSGYVAGGSSAGGTTSFGALVSATGGAGQSNSTGGSIGGSGSGGDLNLSGQGCATQGSGGTSPMGYGMGPGQYASGANGPVGYGSGGSNLSGGNGSGKSGLCIVYEYA